MTNKKPNLIKRSYLYQLTVAVSFHR